MGLLDRFLGWRKTNLSLDDRCKADERLLRRSSAARPDIPCLTGLSAQYTRVGHALEKYGQVFRDVEKIFASAGVYLGGHSAAATFYRVIQCNVANHIKSPKEKSKHRRDAQSLADSIEIWRNLQKIESLIPENAPHRKEVLKKTYDRIYDIFAGKCESGCHNYYVSHLIDRRMGDLWLETYKEKGGAVETGLEEEIIAMKEIVDKDASSRLNPQSANSVITAVSRLCSSLEISKQDNPLLNTMFYYVRSLLNLTHSIRSNAEIPFHEFEERFSDVVMMYTNYIKGK